MSRVIDGGVLADAEALGDRFVAFVGPQVGPGWIPAADLFGSGLSDAVATKREARGAVSDAVAGSLLLAEYCARLSAPVLAVLYRDGAFLDPSLGNVQVLRRAGVIERLSFLRGPQPCPPGQEAGLASRVADAFFAGNIDACLGAVRNQSRAGLRSLWSNVGMTVGSAMLTLSWSSPDRDRYLDDARAFVACRPEIGRVVSFESAEFDGEPWMFTRRDACCLAFRTTVNQTRENPYCSNCSVLELGERITNFHKAARSFEEGRAR
ncbi:hypothetical protein FK531_08060 [Rhodococcus spelaei]|uniref:Uncharacterized protein n=1 Tax=Rhodococcus spelaei TaxID=2546320 RepID=A0A541BME9_9NOCA|nr:IucA/IucC family C-terminal-domain containing protein [Rhodococcus spelaei]TQF73444.1 hypothetical protein FK531_08060 [Rhodococcus spelaei]